MSVRGTTVATYDYAYFNKTILGNESISLYNKNRPENHPDVIAKFEKVASQNNRGQSYWTVS